VDYGISIRPSWLQGVSTTNRDGERHGVVFEHHIGVSTSDRKAGVCRALSLRERRGPWCDGTHLRQTLIETSCTIGISGGIKTAPLWVRHGQGLEIKLAAGQPFNNEHGTGAQFPSPA
jgi:CDGSH-type Zn-finger protein